MAILLPLIAAAVAFAGGLGLFATLSPKSPLTAAERAGVAILLGIGLVSSSSFLLGLAIHGWPLRLAVSILCIATLLLGMRRDPAAFVPRKPFFAGPDVLTALLFVTSLCFVAWVSLFHSDLNWDGLFNWEAKARAAFLNDGAFPLSAFRSDLSHSRYPLLVPLFSAWIYGWIGRVDQFVIQLAGPLFYLATLLLVTGASRRLTGNRWWGALPILLLAAIPRILTGGGSAASGYADWPLAAMYLAAMIVLVDYAHTGSDGAARLAAVLLAFGIWTKVDLLVLLAAVAALIAPRVIAHAEWKRAALILVPAIATYLAWSLLLSATHAVPDGDFHSAAHLERLPMLFRHLVGEMAKWKDWSLFWPLLFMGSAVLAVRDRWSALPWLTGILAPMLLYPAVFVFSAWNPVRDHVESSLSRLLIHLVPSAVLVIVIATAKAYRAAPRLAHTSPPPMQTEDLLAAAAELLSPTGITLEDLRDLQQRKTPPKPPARTARRARH